MSSCCPGLSIGPGEPGEAGLGQTQTCPQQELWSWGWQLDRGPLCFGTLVTCWPSFPGKTGPLAWQPSNPTPLMASPLTLLLTPGARRGPHTCSHRPAQARTRPRQILRPLLSSGCLRIGSERPVPGGDQAGTQAFLCFWEAERDRVSTKHSRVGVQIPAQPQDKGSSSPPAGAVLGLALTREK